MLINKFKERKNKWWFGWLLTGLFIRLVVMPITVHPDLWGQSIASYLFSHQGVVNIYEYLKSVPKDNVLSINYPLKYLYIYPPLTYFTQGFLNLLVKPFLNSDFIPRLIQSPEQILNFKSFHTQVLILKLPYLLVDVLAAFVLASSFKKINDKRRVFALWMINPAAVYTTFMMGQNDILPVFFTCLALFFIARKNYQWAVVSLGIGGSYKLYPLLLIIPCVLVASEKFIQRIKLAILGVLPYLVTVGPFLPSQAYRETVLFNPESTKILFTRIPVSGAEFIYLFVIVTVIVYYLAYYSRKKYSLNTYFISIILPIFAFTHFHPQWFIWTTPFIIWQLVKTDFKDIFLVCVLFILWLVITLMFEPSLSYGMFYSINEGLKNSPGLSEIVARYYDPFVIKSLFRSILTASSFYYLASMYGKRGKIKDII